MEDLGIGTASLATFRQGFYIDGIGGALAKQTWIRDLGATESVPYDHALLCVGSRGWLAVRFQASCDAPGRRQFPLVVALHGADIRMLKAADDIGLLMESVLAEAKAATDAASLREIVSRAQERFEKSSKEWVVQHPPTRDEKSALLRQPELEPAQPSVWRLGHALSIKGAGAGKVRVPVRPSSRWMDFAMWASLLAQMPHAPAVLVTMVSPVTQAFADVHLGPPGARVLAGLFASLAAQPLTNAVPFNVAPELSADVDQAVMAWLADEDIFAEAANEPETKPSGVIEKVCDGLRHWLRS